MKNLYFILILFLFVNACNSGKERPADDRQFFLKIVYNVELDSANDNYEIFVMDFSGANKRNISNHPGVDWAYHTIGDKIYFLSDRDSCHRCFHLYETDIYGTNIRRVTNFRMKDSWMSSRNNGSEMIVTPHPTIDSAFYVINLEGEIIEKIYPGLPYFNDPAFLSDNKKIVFRGSNNKFEKETGYLDELFTMNTDGTGLHQLTHFPVEDTTTTWNDYHAGAPSLIPESDNISYISKQNGTYSIFSIDKNGGDASQITSDGFNQGWHNWSPDAKYIVFDGCSVKRDSNYDIFLMDIEGRNISRLSFDTLYEHAPLFVKVFE